MQICGVPTWPYITLGSRARNVLLIYELSQASLCHICCST